MAHNLVEANTWSAAVVAPDDGDVFTAMSVETPAQDLADRTLYLRTRVPGAAASVVLPFVPEVHFNKGTRFSDGATVGGTDYTCLINTDTTDAGEVHGRLHGMPSTGTITLVTANVTGALAAGAHGGLVGTAPTVALYRVTLSTGVESLVVTTADPYATTDLAVYEVPHTIVSAAVAEVISSDRAYYIQVTGEDGANKANNKFALYGVKLTITP